jgi:subtilisin family serine protease
MGWINGTAPLVERNTDYPITVKVLDTQTRLSDTQSYNLTVIDSDSQKISVEMTLSTIKDNYTIGEVVELTDPPADVVSANADNNERVYSRYDSYETPSERVIAKTDFFSTSEPTPEFQGYIIEFEEETLVEKYVKLKQEAEKNKDRVASQIAGFVLPKSLEPALPSNIESKIVRERTKIKTARETFKQRALQRLGKRQIITGHAIDESQLLVLGEYENTFNGIALNISSEEAEQIEQVPGVKEVYPNYPVKVALMDSVPLINADDVWKLDSTGGNCATSGKPCLTGKGVTIGIIDTGVDYTHPDLGGCIGANCKVVGGYDFVNGDSNPMDDQGHGTHVAATAAGNGVLKGVAPDAKIYAYKVMNQKGEGDVSNIIKAIERTVDPNQDGNFADHLDIISLSLGIGCKYYFGEYSENCGPDDPMSKAIDSAVSAGVVAVVAAGNDGDFGEGSVGSPGTARKAITVGAVYSKDYSGSYWQDYNPKKDSIVSFSSRGPVIWSNGSIIKPDIVAPGALICAARYDSIYPEGRHPYYKPCLDERHVLLAGTSMATPNVAGVVALLKQKNPAWTPEEIKMALRSTAKDLGYDTNSQGYGRVDILNAANLKGVPSVVKIDTSGIVSGKINIIGTASGREFKNYTLYYKTGDSAEWIKLKTSTTPLNNGILYSSFDTGLLAEDELSYLKLASWNSKGEKSEDNCLITANNFRMISPLSRDILRKGDLVKIKGIIPYNIKKLIVYSAEGVYFNTDQLKNANWKLLKTTSSILGGSVERELATWDTTTLNDGFHNLKIEVETEFSNITEFIYPLFLDSRIKKGWPIYLDMGESGSQIANEGYQPEVDDLDNDGKKEIIFVQTTIGHPPILRLMAYNYSGGIKWYKDLPETHPQGIISTQKTIGDLDNDGKKEIFVVYECNLNYDHFIHRFRYNGEEYLGNGWPMKLDTNDPYTLTIADLNGDAVSELIAYGGTVQTPEGDFNNILSFIGNAGKIRDILIPRCELFKTNQIYAPSASVGNFDEDENLEVAVRIGCNGIGLYNFDGSSVDGWPTYISGFIWGGRFSIGDIDGDTNSEIVVPAVSLTNTSNNELLYEGGIYVLNKSGGLLPGWPFNALKSFVSPVALGDLNNDDKLEIVAQYSGGKRDKLILNYGGEIISGWPKRFQPEFGYTPLSSAPVITDVNGDSKNDVIFNDGGFSSKIYEGRVGALGGLMAYNLNGSPIKLGINDEIMPFILLDMSSRENSPVITDLENNKKTDIVIGLPLEAKDRIILYAFELNAPYNPLTAEWPTFMHDPQHTGCYDCGPKATPPTRPKSQILNKGSANIQGYLLMRVQKKQTRGGWANVRTIVNDTKTSTLRTVPAVAALGLDTIWKNAGAYKTTGTGTFRVYAALTDSKGKVLTDSTGKPLNATAQFRVI